jgi:hypothetical protein
MKIIDEVIDNSDDKSLESGVDSINKVKDKLKKYLIQDIENEKLCVIILTRSSLSFFF